MTALSDTSQNDENAFVREQARKAYETLREIDGQTAPSGPYVDIGEMSSKVDDMRALMKRTVISTLKSQASNLTVEWPGKKAPTKKDLGALTAFHVDGTLNELTAKKQGSRTIVSCKVNMLLATYPEKSMFGFLKGGASIETSSSEREVQLAKEDCVSAVVEDLVANKIIPTIRSRAR